MGHHLAARICSSIAHTLRIENPKTSNPLTRFKPLSTPKERMPDKSKGVSWPSSMPIAAELLVNRGVSEPCQFKIAKQHVSRSTRRTEMTSLQREDMLHCGFEVGFASKNISKNVSKHEADRLHFCDVHLKMMLGIHSFGATWTADCACVLGSQMCGKISRSLGHGQELVDFQCSCNPFETLLNARNIKKQKLTGSFVSALRWRSTAIHVDFPGGNSSHTLVNGISGKGYSILHHLNASPMHRHRRCNQQSDHPSCSKLS